jgi:hypothetical protein
LAGKGGIRIEDMVVVTDRGCRVLTPVSKELVEIYGAMAHTAVASAAGIDRLPFYPYKPVTPALELL